MCGIFAVSGAKEDGGNMVIDGLKKLEYRGYDSWGVSAKVRGDSQIEKSTGKISEVEGVAFGQNCEAMGHTRWATHGGVTDQNAHPHKVGKVTVVHNGIFEDFQAVKEKFLSEGKSFASQTDTEVIAMLLNEILEEKLRSGKKLSTALVEDILAEGALQITGRFAVLVMVDGVDGFWAARRGSPLIVGRDNSQTFVASDIPAFLEYTNTVNYLDDNEVVYVNGVEVIFKDLETLRVIEKRDVKVEWEVETVDKGDFDHFMMKEIFDQKNTLLKAIEHSDQDLARAVNLLREVNGAYLVACGTANKAAMAAEYFFAEISGRKLNVAQASEMPYFERFVHDRTAVIAISQSGETADVLEVLEDAKRRGAKILALTNVSSSSMARLADVHLPIQAGVEKSVASTKALTSQMALLFLLAYGDSAGVQNFEERLNTARQLLRSTSGNINDLLNPRYSAHVKSVAEKLYQHENMFIIGRGSLYPMALEAAIKIQEVSYIHAQGFAAGELKHGPIALIEEGVPCMILGNDPETISNAMELKSRGGLILGVATENNPVFDYWFRVPDCDGAQAIASVVPVQIFAYFLATLRGLDPDMPRNLAKSVTVK